MVFDHFSDGLGEIKQRLQNMIGAELSVVGAQDDTAMLVKRIMDWKNGGK